MRGTRIALVVVLATALMVASGCKREDSETPADAVHRSKTIDIGRAERVDVELTMGLGNLDITTGADDLMEAQFVLSDELLEPDVKYMVDSQVGALEMRQTTELDNGKDWWADYLNEWNLNFNEDVPLDVKLVLGAGETEIHLGEADVRKLDIDGGAGAFVLDLNGSRKLGSVDFAAGAGNMTFDFGGDKWETDLNASITTGAGDMKIVLPRETAARVRIRGVGDVTADSDGVQEKDGAWVNDAYLEGDPDVVLDITMKRGAGEVSVSVE